MGAVVNATGLLHARTGAHILWVHHTPLDGAERMRGHGALLGALDTTIHVTKGAGSRVATVIKANDAEEGEAINFTLDGVTIGQDADGNLTTAPVVVPLDGPPPRQQTTGARLTKAAQTALRALNEALDEQGEPAPTSNHIPVGVKVVTVPLWRQHAYRRGISSSEEERARQQAFKRAYDYLLGSNRVHVWDGLAWLV